jgi:hypothetical protein
MKDGHKVLCLFDPHIKTKPTKNESWKPDTSIALETALQFGEWWKPDETITGQDFMEFDEISFWNRNNRLELEGRRLSCDFEYGNQILDRICNFTKERVVFIPGNHDYWLKLYILERPELHNLIDQNKLLNFKKRDIHNIEYGKVYKVGKASFAHAFLRPRKSSGVKYHSFKMAEDYGSSIFYGHFHTFQAFTRTTWDTKPNIAVSIGCLTDLNPSWMRNCPNDFTHQILFFEFDKNGHFSFYCPIMINGKFSYAGKVFGNGR